MERLRGAQGVPIPPQIRKPLEAALGHDFSAVRVHTGALADPAARAIGAEAFTLRGDIVFARGRFAPTTPAGLNLLAHEVVHTIQQGAARPLSASLATRVTASTGQIQARQDPTSGPRSDVDSEIADKQADQDDLNEKTCGTGENWAAVLYEVVGEGDKADSVKYNQQRNLLRDITDRIVAVERALCENDMWGGDIKENDNVAEKGIGGLIGPIRRLVDQELSYKPKAKDPDNGDTRRGAFLAEVVGHLRTIELRLPPLYQGGSPSRIMIDWIRQKSPGTTENVPWGAEQHIGNIAEKLSISRDLPAPIEQVETNLNAAEMMITAFALRQEGAGWVRSIESHFIHLQSSVQAVIDGLLQGGSPQGSTPIKTVRDHREQLRRLYILMERLRALLLKPSEPGADGHREVESTSDEYSTSRPEGKHTDVFGSGAEVAFNPYEAASMDGLRLKQSLLELTEARIKQIRFLAKFYGARLHEKDYSHVSGEDSSMSVEERAERRDEANEELTLFGGRMMNIHSDTDWRKYLRRVYEGHRNDPTMYKTIVGLIGEYLDAFTVHSPFNIEDIGVNYIGRKFPRSLAGQLLHDCGVYGVRVAYMLSELRAELGLTFHAVRLPFHFALEIRSSRGLPTLVVNNNHLDWVSDVALRARNVDPATVPVGELAAHYFSPGARMPYSAQELDFPARKRGLSEQERDQRAREFDMADAGALWSGYRATAPSPSVEGKDLGYLRNMMSATDAFNRHIYTVWGETLPALWRRTVDALKTCGSGGGSVACKQKVLTKYHRESLALLRKAVRAYQDESDAALTAIPHARPAPQGAGLAPTGVSPIVSSRGLDDGLAVPGAQISHPERFAPIFESRASQVVRQLEYLLANVQAAELAPSATPTDEGSYKVEHDGVLVAPVRYSPPFLRRDHMINKQR